MKTTSGRRRFRELTISHKARLLRDSRDMQEDVGRDPFRFDQCGHVRASRSFLQCLEPVGQGTVPTVAMILRNRREGVVTSFNPEHASRRDPTGSALRRGLWHRRTTSPFLLAQRLCQRRRRPFSCGGGHPGIAGCRDAHAPAVHLASSDRVPVIDPDRKPNFTGTAMESASQFVRQIISSRHLPSDLQQFLEEFASLDNRSLELQEGALCTTRRCSHSRRSDDYFVCIVRPFVCFSRAHMDGLIVFGVDDSSREITSNSVNIPIEAFNSALRETAHERHRVFHPSIRYFRSANLGHFARSEEGDWGPTQFGFPLR